MFRGPLSSGFLYQLYAEDEHANLRLGRHQWLDGGSLAYMVENDAHQMGKALRDQHWDRVLPILDQGNLGSCTGNAGTGALGTQPLYDASGKGVLPANLDAAAGEAFAVQLDSDATVADGHRGKYPPDDTGSSGLAICRVLRSRGAISRYRWARSAYGLLQLLQAGPVLQGMPRYRAFFQPDASGFIDADPAWAGSGLAGGHEIGSGRGRDRRQGCLQQRRDLRKQLRAGWTAASSGRGHAPTNNSTGSTSNNSQPDLTPSGPEPAVWRLP